MSYSSMSFSVTVIRAAQAPVHNGAFTTYSFLLTAENPVNMSPAIFRMRVGPLDNTVNPPIQNVYFDGVCTPYDLQNLPVYAPVAPDDVFRLASVIVTYTNQAFGEDAWQDIQANIQLLIDSLVAGSELVIEESVTFGGGS